MTSKERVHRALQRQPVDRVPIFMWYHPQQEIFDKAAQIRRSLRP